MSTDDGRTFDPAVVLACRASVDHLPRADGTETCDRCKRVGWRAGDRIRPDRLCAACRAEDPSP